MKLYLITILVLSQYNMDAYNYELLNCTHSSLSPGYLYSVIRLCFRSQVYDYVEDEGVGEGGDVEVT